MKYDLIISKIDRLHKTTIAKLLCQDPAISLQKAMSMLDNLPITYKSGLSKGEAKKDIEKLKALGAVVSPIESKVKDDPVVEILEAEDSKKNVREIKNEKTDVGLKSYNSKNERKAVNKYKNQNISRIGVPVKKKKSKKHSGVAVLIGVAILFTLLILQGLKKPEYKIRQDARLISKSSSSNGKNGKESSTKEKKKFNLNFISSYNEKKAKENAKKVSESNSYGDSAEMFLNDPDEMIRFYKIAISINRKNFNAWNGLVNAYANLGMSKEANQAKEEMKKIFGDEMFSVEKLIRPYGKLVSFNIGKGEFCRIEYKSKSKKRVDLESDSFLILKSLNNSIGCGKYSIYAATQKGKGLLVRYDASEFPNSFSDYLLKAQINFIE